MQLDLCPSYPSKSQEEGGRLEQLEKKRKKRPLGPDGCDKRYFSLIPFLVPSFLPFVQVTLMAGSPLAVLPKPPVSSKSRHAIQISGDLEVIVTALRPLCDETRPRGRRFHAVSRQK